MKSILTAILIVTCTVFYGQNRLDSILYRQGDSLTALQYRGPDIRKTFYPNDGFTYNQYVGETIAGHNLADSWRRDTINGGFNKEVYDNPYNVFSNVDKFTLDNKFVFYRYKEGRRYTGAITDTCTSCSNVRAVIIFKAKSRNGLVQGKGTFYNSDGTILSEGTFKDGEIVGEWTVYSPQKAIIRKCYYRKGSGAPYKIKEYPEGPKN